VRVRCVCCARCMRVCRACRVRRVVRVVRVVRVASVVCFVRVSRVRKGTFFMEREMANFCEEMKLSSITRMATFTSSSFT
jgi:hypothetical protein